MRRYRAIEHRRSEVAPASTSVPLHPVDSPRHRGCERSNVWTFDSHPMSLDDFVRPVLRTLSCGSHVIRSRPPWLPITTDAYTTAAFAFVEYRRGDDAEDAYYDM
jgi:hypothetical protein